MAGAVAGGLGLFSAAMAGVAMALDLPYPGWIITLVGYFGLLFATEKTADSGWGLLFVFLLTGFMGYTLGPIINMYLTTFNNGGQIVMLALGGTGAIFVGMSGYALVSGRRFNQWAATLFIGILVAFVMSLIGAIFHIAIISMAGSFLFVLPDVGTHCLANRRNRPRRGNQLYSRHGDPVCRCIQPVPKLIDALGDGPGR